MSGFKVEEYMDESDYRVIRRSGRRPMVAVYRVAHEGVSTGPLAGVGRMAKRWSASSVEELAGLMRGAPVFIGHTMTAGPRRPVGYVLRAKKIDGPGGAEAVAIVAIEDPRAIEEVDRMELNTASIEADITVSPGEPEWTVSGVEAVTGLALASASSHPPGFRHAELLACARELDDPAAEPHAAPADDGVDVAAAEMKDMNLNEVERAFVRRRLAERVPIGDESPEIIRAEVTLALRALDEAKRLYRRAPLSAPIPFERKRGPVNYSDPDHNDFIP